jgi:hypothetical protein
MQWRSLIEKLERAKELFWVENGREQLVWIELNGVLPLNMHLDRAGHGTLLLQRSSASVYMPWLGNCPRQTGIPQQTTPHVQE